MKYINIILAIVSTLAAVPSGWAIYAGVTGQDAFPMNPIAAGIGAVSILIVGLTASMLITDTYQFNQTAQAVEEKSNTQPIWWSWGILFVAIVSEIVLSLVIVVFDGLLKYGVVVFPIMTVAGMLAASARKDLEVRQSWRVAHRLQVEEQEQERLAKEEQAEKERLMQEAQERQGKREYRRKLQERKRQEQEQVPQVPVSTEASGQGSIGSDENLLGILHKSPGKSQQYYADHFGVSRSAVGQRIKKLKETGKLQNEFALVDKERP